LFVDLRKQACQLENEIDLKLVSFSKLGTNYSSIRDYGSQIKSVVMFSYKCNLMEKLVGDTLQMFKVISSVK